MTEFDSVLDPQTTISTLAAMKSGKKYLD